MSEYKKQYYVPQLLQRQFSTDDANIACYNIARDIEIISPISTTAQKSWFYKTNASDKVSIEKVYGSIESDAGPLVSRINDDDFGFTAEECEKLFVFAVAQLMRSPKAAHAMGDILGICKQRGVKIVCDEIANGTRTYENLPMQASISIPAVVKHLSGKAFVYLVNDTEVDFILSDNPAVMFSPAAEVAEERNITDIMQAQEPFSGYMLYLPLGLKVGVLYFDDDYYNLGDDAIIQVSQQDAITLNGLEVRCAINTLMFKEGTFDKTKISEALKYRCTEKFQRYQRTIYTPIDRDFSLSFFSIDEEMLINKMYLQLARYKMKNEEI